MVGDNVASQPSRNGWRPPHLSANPNYTLHSPPMEDSQNSFPESEAHGQPENERKFRNSPDNARKFLGGGSHRQVREGPWRRNSQFSEEYDLEAGRYFDDSNGEESARFLLSKRQKVMEKHREYLRRGMRGKINLSFEQRVCALLLSISVGLSLLGIIATLLSSKMDVLEKTLSIRKAALDLS